MMCYNRVNVAGSVSANPPQTKSMTQAIARGERRTE